MGTFTLPKPIAKSKEVVVVRRRDYEKFIKLVKTRLEDELELDRSLTKALKQVERGEVFGPFDSAEELMRSIEG